MDSKTRNTAWLSIGDGNFPIFPDPSKKDNSIRVETWAPEWGQVQILHFMWLRENGDWWYWWHYDEPDQEPSDLPLIMGEDSMPTHWKYLPQPPAFKIKHSMKYQLLLISAATMYAQQYNGDPTAMEAWAKQVTGNEHPGLEFEDTDSVNVTIDGEKVNIAKDSDYLTWNGTAWGKMTADELAAEHTITGQAKWTLAAPGAVQG